MSDEQNDRKMDDFWNIEKLIPQKKNTKKVVSHAYDTESVEVILKAKESTSYDKLETIEMRPSEKNRGLLSFVPQPPEKTEPDEEYSPQNPFIKSVKIFKKNDFGYYSSFYEDGVKYYEIQGHECSEPSFFSWVPQYSQLDPDQLAFYFYMRSELRAGRYIKASYSYVLLYIFELINIEKTKSNALSQLSFVWRSYRKHYPKLDSLMKEWISDFCFINRLSPNSKDLGDAYKIAAETAIVRELFLCGDKTESELLSSDELAGTLLRYCSNYDWRTSKFATKENIPLYEKHILGALKKSLLNFRGENSFFVGFGELKREAFLNALCTPSCKYRIEVSFCSLTRSHELRFLITDIVKHTENRIRGYLGIKSRLTIYSLPVNVRKSIDEYMDSALPGKRMIRKNEEQNEYDKLYDLPKHTFSLESAKKIEESSWNTTKKLIEAFEDEEKTDAETDSVVEIFSPVVVEDGNVKSEEEMLLEALKPYMDFISSALSCDLCSQNRISLQSGLMIDSLADKINEISAEIYGDIILEKNGEVYTVIEVYREVFENAGDK